MTTCKIILPFYVHIRCFYCFSVLLIFCLEYILGENEVTQSCLTLCDPVNCSLPSSSIHGIFQARVLEWVAISFTRVSSWPRDRTQVSCTGSRTLCHLSHQGSQYTEEQYKKDVHDPDNHDGVITHLEPDILEWEVKWALGRWWNSSWTISNPKRWCCESAALNMSANLDNSAVATGLEKVSFHSNPKERQCQRMLKLPHNCTHLTC